MNETQTTGHHVVATAVDTSMIGVVLGNYRITEALAAGGMGSVYRAQHELLDRPAAIKLLRPELSENEELVQRFFNEAKAATAIRHPGIVDVYDYGFTDDGHAYYVMEYLDGLPLSRAIAERSRFGELEAASIARSIASALKAAHAKGIIHRDLKPDNVFLIPDPDGLAPRVKVLDFGIAKLVNPAPTDRRRTRAGVLMGTPKYMAPEQAREAAGIDARADLYALGCMLYELVCGEPPFVAEGAGEIVAMQLFAEPEPPSKRIDISPELEHIIMRLLDKEPSGRFQSAHELMDALVAVGAGMSGPRAAIDSRSDLRIPELGRSDTLPAVPTAELTTPDTPSGVARRSWRWPLVLVGVTAAAVAATIVVLVTRETREPAPPPPAPPMAASPAPAPPTAPPATAAPPQPTPAPPVAAAAAPPEDAAVKKKRPPRTPAKSQRTTQQSPTEDKQPPAPPAAQAPTQPAAPAARTTDKGSPIEDKL